jgi:signal transduction histidine kinase
MAASTFAPAAAPSGVNHVVDVTAQGVAGMVVVPSMVLGIAVLTSMVDRLQESIERQRALTNRLQSSREEERTRIAREIHVELGQALTAIKLGLSALVRAVPEEFRPSKRA